MTLYKLTTDNHRVYYFYVQGLAEMFRNLRGGHIETVHTQSSAVLSQVHDSV
jgi:hypothetical protein